MDNDYVQRAREYHQAGYNCAQSVACAFLPVLPIDEKTLFSVMEGFGGGMGGTDATCGALSGAVAVISLLSSGGKVGTKKQTYDLAATAVSRFAEKSGSLVCRELKGSDTGVPLAECSACIDNAVLLVQQIMQVK